ncbi:hypothetical protein SAMN05444422_101767 [Halobiforma haloterrestris]|uniref:Uncharacterized protein n=1 Tax=Natronobacterium haloterrestre TaxID=148448 RepID=A0A1I1DRH2_NATHA|nr:hypothetical protein [Halobiforma haloterrestris]SFB75638.1 hypothetical protein SAMN05444422_101767 [Halobiforma haloterrestris]
MSLETYRLEVREIEAGGIDADVYGDDDLIVESTHVGYDEHDVEQPDSREEYPAESTEITADVTTLDLQVTRLDGGFSFRLLGDRDELTSLRVDDEEWGLE